MGVFSVRAEGRPYTWTWFCRTISPGTPIQGQDENFKKVTTKFFYICSTHQLQNDWHKG